MEHIKHIPMRQPLIPVDRQVFLGTSHNLLSYLNQRTGREAVILEQEADLNDIIDTIFDNGLVRRDDLVIVADDCIFSSVQDVAMQRSLSCLILRPFAADWRW